MTNPNPRSDDAVHYGELLLTGIQEVREHIAEWGRAEDSTPARNLASGYLVGLLGEEIGKLQNDPDRLELMNVLAPSFLAVLRDMREAEQADG
jgi:hypothetical protein